MLEAVSRPHVAGPHIPGKKGGAPHAGIRRLFCMLKKAAEFRVRYTLAAVRKSVTASVFSQVNSGSSRPKCP